MVTRLDTDIDELYKGPLESFTASRNALARSLSGDEKKRVMALAKPQLIPWLVNQTYWDARDAYDELLSSGKKLRAAQVGGLQGRSTDVRAASDEHEKALSAAVAEAMRLAAAAHVNPQPDALRRMFDAISTRASLPAEHGRFVKTLEPAGFEALAGLSLATPLKAVERPSGKESAQTDQDDGALLPSAKEIKAAKQAREEERRRERERAAAERRRAAAIEKARAKLAAAEQAENRARFEWERAKKDVEAASRALEELTSSET